MSEFLDIAIIAARNSGKYLMDNRGKIYPANIDEKARNDFVTYVDQNSEKMIIEMILNHFPDHNILAEEGTHRNQKSDFRWIIDPLDGTKNFIEDIPFFSISIALQKKNEIIIGVVCNPAQDELFTAEKGKGAFCNAKQISVNKKKLSDSLVATGFPFRAKRNLPNYLLAFEEIFLKCSGMRRMGSAAIDLSYTAMGRFAGFWEIGLSTWDMAAGSLLIKEAGGIVTDFQGNDNFLQSGYIVAGNPASHLELLTTLRHYFY